jgi:hypothetical protein
MPLMVVQQFNTFAHILIANMQNEESGRKQGLEEGIIWPDIFEVNILVHQICVHSGCMASPRIYSRI